MAGGTSRRRLTGSSQTRTAADSNIVSALWMEEPTSADCQVRLENARRRGALVICAPVYCELHACPGITAEIINNFLQDTAIVADFTISEEVWQEAALRFARYASRRRRSGGTSPKRMLIDFLVGAHALL